MREALSLLAILMLAAACQAPPTATPGAPAVTTASAGAGTVPSNRAHQSPRAKSPAAPATTEIASWETSHPFSLAALVERRLKGALVPTDRRHIDIAAAHALAGERGALHPWRTDRRDHRGMVRLVRRTAADDGRVCARLHHEHRIGRRTLRGSVRICRQRGDSTAPWAVDDVRWTRLGSDLARIVGPRPTAPFNLG